MAEHEFKTQLGYEIFKNKYAQNRYETWHDRAHTVVDAVCGTNMGTETPLMDKADLESYGAMLVAFRGIVAKEMAAGKDLDAILKAKPTAELDAKWGGAAFAPDKFTELVFRSLETK